MKTENLVSLRVVLASAFEDSGLDTDPGYIVLTDGHGRMIPVLTEASQVKFVRWALAQSTSKKDDPISKGLTQDTRRIVIRNVENIPLTNTPSQFSTIFGKKYLCVVENESAEMEQQTTRLTDGIGEALLNSWPIYITNEAMKIAGVSESDLQQSGFNNQEGLTQWFKKLPPSSCYKA